MRNSSWLWIKPGNNETCTRHLLCASANKPKGSARTASSYGTRLNTLGPYEKQALANNQHASHEKDQFAFWQTRGFCESSCVKKWISFQLVSHLPALWLQLQEEDVSRLPCHSCASQTLLGICKERNRNKKQKKKQIKQNHTRHVRDVAQELLYNRWFTDSNGLKIFSKPRKLNVRAQPHYEVWIKDRDSIKPYKILHRFSLRHYQAHWTAADKAMDKRWIC